MSFKRDLLTRLLPHLPDALLSKALRGRSYIVENVPRGREFVWPYYLGNASVLVNTDNPIERESLTGTYDLEVSRHVAQFVRLGDVAIDGGANVGLVTLLLAKAVGSEGRVYAIEPGEVYLKRLKKNLELNPHLSDVVAVLPVGISDAEGVMTWAADPGAPYNASFLPDSEASLEGATSLPVTTLDALTRSEGLDRLDFVKLDLEGMELWALKGAREVLDRFRPAVLFESLEIFRHARGRPDVFLDIGELLTAAGYGLYHLPPDGQLVSVTPEHLPANTLALHDDDPRGMK